MSGLVFYGRGLPVGCAVRTDLFTFLAANPGAHGLGGPATPYANLEKSGFLRCMKADSASIASGERRR